MLNFSSRIVMLLSTLLAMTLAHAHSSPDRCLSGESGKLLEVSTVQTLSTVQGEDLWTDYEHVNLYELGYISAPEPFEANYPVTIYRVLYCVSDIDDGDNVQSDSEVVEAGGAVVLPSGQVDRLPVVYYIGTEICRNCVISVSTDPLLVYEGQTAALQFAMSAGLPVLLPNGPGFDGSELQNDWYFMSDVYAEYGLALLEAVESFPAYTATRSAGDLYVSGFSAGAHNALALVRKLEEVNTPPTAVGLVEGVYDVESWVLHALAQDLSGAGFFSLYMADLSYTAVRSAGVGTMAGTYVTPYRNTVPIYFGGSRYFWTVEPHMPDDPQDLFTSAFYSGVTTSSNHPYRTWLREQNLLDVEPTSDLLVVHSSSDEEVPVELTDDFVDGLPPWVNVTYHRVSGTDHLSTWHSGWDLLRKDALAHE